MIAKMINYAIQDSQRYMQLTKEHLLMYLAAFIICILIAVPLGYICAKHEKYQFRWWQLPI